MVKLQPSFEMFAYVVLACLLASCHGLFTYDPGLPARFRGWGDVNGDGKVDYCRFICPKAACLDKDVVFCCHISGQTNQCGYTSNPGFESGRTSYPTQLIDADGDNRADFCRFLVPPQGGDPIPYCRLAGRDRWSEDEIAWNFVPGQEGFKFRRL